MKPYSPLTLQQRIDSSADQTVVAKAKADQAMKDMFTSYDQLMAAEAEVLGKAHGWEGVVLSGLVPEGGNRYVGGTGDSEPDFAAYTPRQVGSGDPDPLPTPSEEFPKPTPDPPPPPPPEEEEQEQAS